MPPLRLSSEQVAKVISDALDQFYERRLNALTGLKLKDVLKRKNPYLFKAAGVLNAGEIIDGLLKAYMSSSEEGIFGDTFFEPIAVIVSGGVKSITDKVDIEVREGNLVRAYAIKSGPSIFNSSSWQQQVLAFEKCRARLSAKKLRFEAIVGYGYGRKKSKPGANPRHVSGQALWEELTGNPNFYLDMLDLMKKRPIEHLTQYQEAYAAAKNRFVAEFVQDFCYPDGRINWHTLAKYNSGKTKKADDPPEDNGETP